MKQLCIIPCGRKKIWDKEGDIGPVTAKDAYIGIFHNLCEQYATAFCDEWVILSAKYGYLFPDDIVYGNYDVTFNQKSDEIISINQLIKQVDEKKLNSYHHLVVLTGKKYRPIVESSFTDSETIQYPLLGTNGIGHMQQLLKNSINDKMPLHK